jgi:TP901 family phage tail tape measure protein
MNLEEVARLRLEILGDDAEQTVQNLEKGLKDINSELRLMELNGDKGSEAWKELKKVQSDVKDELKEVKKAIDINDASWRELSALSKQLNRDLQNLKIGSEEWIEQLKKIAEVEDRMSDVRQEMDKIKDAGEDQKGFWTTFKATFTAAFAWDVIKEAGQAIYEFGKQAILTAAEYSDNFADIQKTTGMTNAEVRELNTLLQGLNTRTSQIDLLNISKIGGQIGIAKEEMFGFVEAVDKAVVALGDEFSGGAEEVAKKMGVLKNLFKETKELDAGEAINAIGSAINELGAVGSATGPVIADFTQRMGQLGDLSPQIGQTMGLGAAFEELGLSAEIASGGLTNILLTAASETEKFAKHLGLTDQAFKDLINTNPNEVILKLAESFKGLPTDQVIKELKDLGINSQEATKVMSLLADQTDFVREKQEIGIEALIKASSTTDEFNIKNETLAAQLDKAGKAVEEVSFSLGDGLAPTVSRVVDGFIEFVHSMGDVVTGALPIVDVFVSLGEILFDTIGSIVQTVASMFGLKTETIGVTSVMEGLAVVFRLIGTVLGGGLAIIQAVADGLRGLMKLDFTDLTTNLQANFKRISSMWETSQKEIGETSTKTQGTITANAVKAENDISKNAKAQSDYRSGEEIKAAKKSSDEKVKANEEALKAIGKAEAAAYKDDLQRNLANENAKYAEDKKRIEKSKADAGLKAKWLEALEKEHTTKIEKINADYNTKKEKADQQTAQKIDAMQAKFQADDLSRKIAAIEAAAKKDLAEARSLVTNKEQLAKLEAAIDAKKVADITAARDKDRKETEAKEKAARDLKLKEEKTLFDNEFRAFQAKTEAELANTRDGSNAQLQFKLKNLAEEYAFKQRKLQMEANDEKARLAESIKDTDARAQALKNIDDRLTNQLKTNDAQLQAEKTRLLAEQHQNRLNNTKGFFDAVEGLAKGDFASFTNFLLSKVKNDQAANDSRLKSFSENGVKTLEVAAQVVEGMQQLNQAYLESKLKKIEKEKQSQLDSWEEEYKAGRISKIDYQRNIDRINAEAAAKEKNEKLKAWKRDQAMQIGMALINAAMAALKSLATMGFPLGLIGVAASAGLAAIQIGIIKRQSPPSFADGGTLPAQNYVRNAGVPEGPGHGSSYGKSGIALMRRDTGQEVGEMEGDEPIMILSRQTYKNNRRTIDRLLHSSLHRNGAPIHARDGAVFWGGDSPVEPLRYGESYLFGSKKKKAAYNAQMQAQYDADMMAKQQQEEMANMDYSNYDSGDSYDDYGGDTGGGYEGEDYAGGTYGGGGSADATVGSTNAQINKSQQMMEAIAKNTAATVSAVNALKGSVDQSNSLLNDIRNKPTGPSLHEIQGAVAAATASNAKSDL